MHSATASKGRPRIARAQEETRMSMPRFARPPIPAKDGCKPSSAAASPNDGDTPSERLRPEAVTVLSTASIRERWNRATENRSAFSFSLAGSKAVASRRRIAPSRLAQVCSWNKIPVLPSITDSRLPPVPKATTGRPQACASNDAIPKSSRPGTTSARQSRYSNRSSSSGT